MQTTIILIAGLTATQATAPVQSDPRLDRADHVSRHQRLELDALIGRYQARRFAPPRIGPNGVLLPAPWQTIPLPPSPYVLGTPGLSSVVATPPQLSSDPVPAPAPDSNAGDRPPPRTVDEIIDSVESDSAVTPEQGAPAKEPAEPGEEPPPGVDLREWLFERLVTERHLNEQQAQRVWDQLSRLSDREVGALVNAYQRHRAGTARATSPREQALLSEARSNLERAQAFRDHLRRELQFELLQRQMQADLLRAAPQLSLGGPGYLPPPALYLPPPPVAPFVPGFGPHYAW